jgi:hypothetical protein
MPNAMNNMKIAGEVGLKPRKLLWAMAAGLLIAYVVAWASQLKLAYTHGSVSYSDSWGGTNICWALGGTIYRNVFRPSAAPGRFLGLGIGAALCGALTLLRTYYFWWPLSPIGLLLCGLFPMRMMWFSIFLAWLIKLLIMKYGGGRGYRIGRTFFLGMLLGEALMAGTWMAAGLVVGRNVYRMLPT